MDIKLIQLPIFFLFVMTLSSLAFAGSEGEGCSSKKGHQELSADALKNNDKKQFWSKFFEQHSQDKTASHDNKTIEKIDKKAVSGLIES